MRINRVFAESHETGELTLKGFSYIKDTLPDDFEVCLIIEKNGHLSAGCWDTGLRSTCVRLSEPHCRQGYTV